MTDDDVAELADLRAKAYGPRAEGLTERESARLRALEDRLAGRRATRASSGGAAPDADATDDTHGDMPHAAMPARASSGSSRRMRASVRTVGTIALAALVPVAALGGYLAAGAMGDGHTPSVAHTSAPFLLPGDTPASYEDRRLVVQRALGWDGERVRFLGAAENITVWWGTYEGSTCVAIDVAQTDTAILCDETDAVRDHGMRQEAQFRTTADSASDGVDLGDEGGAGADEYDYATIVFAGNPYTGQFLLLRDRWITFTD